jgi:hypothetical protein
LLPGAFDPTVGHEAKPDFFLNFFDPIEPKNTKAGKNEQEKINLICFVIYTFYVV